MNKQSRLKFWFNEKVTILAKDNTFNLKRSGDHGT